MKTYSTEWIRNVGITGHGDTGKTQLTSALLHTAGMTPRFGKVGEGSTVTDWDEEEIARKISIQTGVAYAEWGNAKINLLDTPGYSTFVNETKASLIAADAALILVDAAAGVQVVTEKVWDFAAASSPASSAPSLRSRKSSAEASYRCSSPWVKRRNSAAWWTWWA
jgi:elongation factor G